MRVGDGISVGMLLVVVQTPLYLDDVRNQSNKTTARNVRVAGRTNASVPTRSSPGMRPLPESVIFAVGVADALVPLKRFPGRASGAPFSSYRHLRARIWCSG